MLNGFIDFFLNLIASMVEKKDYIFCVRIFLYLVRRIFYEIQRYRTEVVITKKLKL